MSKYIIDTETWANLFEVQRVGVYGIGNDIVTDEKTVWSRMFSLDELEELNSDYINEHYGSLQDEAYKQGYAEAERIWRAPSSDNEFYQKGLGDAWEAARKLFSSMADSDIEKAFPIEWNNGGFKALMNLQPQEAIAKIKAYDDKHSDRIEVGDEVEWEGEKFTILRVFTPKGCYEQCDGFDDAGNGYTNILTKDVKKTGKHYDIASILEAMRTHD